MRQKCNPQMSLFTKPCSKPIARELEQISKILDETPRLMEIVYDDLVREKRADTGREGMTAEQVLRSAILKQYR
ncbi:MAG TPA: ISNCY family transposase, partial [Deltaproteobacteria bacterium]|nr:ISNCY family transposase [Deltaproteobacteria bacterium]